MSSSSSQRHVIVSNSSSHSKSHQCNVPTGLAVLLEGPRFALLAALVSGLLLFYSHVPAVVGGELQSSVWVGKLTAAGPDWHGVHGVNRSQR